MITKSIIQYSLVILLIILSIFIYKEYLGSEKSLIEKSEKIDENIKNSVTVENDKGSNTIENLKYVSEDLFGNTYIITADSASFKKDQENQLELYTVNAKIIQNNDDIILIYSGLADYDKISNNTIFKEDVTIKYKDQELNSNIVKLNFSTNLIEILENVYYVNKSTEIYADKAEIDLLNKKMKISMINQKDKVKISGKY